MSDISPVMVKSDLEITVTIFERLTENTLIVTNKHGRVVYSDKLLIDEEGNGNADVLFYADELCINNIVANFTEYLGKMKPGTKFKMTLEYDRNIFIKNISRLD